MFDPALVFCVGTPLVTTRKKLLGRLVNASTLTTLVPGISSHLWEPCFSTKELDVQLLDSIGQGKLTHQRVPTNDEWKERRWETPKNLSDNLIVAVRAAKVIYIALSEKYVVEKGGDGVLLGELDSFNVGKGNTERTSVAHLKDGFDFQESLVRVSDICNDAPDGRVDRHRQKTSGLADTSILFRDQGDSRQWRT
jgi:hypothetical protein